jgi:hypothetical protein
MTSCIDGREEVWIKPNGSGRAEIHYSLPARAVQMKGGDAAVLTMIRDFIKSTPEISASTCDVRTEGDLTKVRVTTEFDSALDLQNAAEGAGIAALPPAAISLAGVVEAKLDGRSLAFTRTIRPADALPGSSFLPMSTFEGHRLDYIIHLPDVPTTHNATRTENSGRTLVWEKPLAEAIRSPIVTHFRMDIPIPWKWIGSIAAGLAVAAGLFVVRRMKPARP